MTTLRFIHSPFVGPDTWREVADVMKGYGWSVALPSLAEAFSGNGPYLPRLAEAVWSAAAAGEPTVLIAHGGAGALVPSALAVASVDAIILVDALVAVPGSSWRLEAPAELTERLDTFVDCGLLPEWHRWFSARLLREMLPDDEVCETFIEALPRVPATFLDEIIPDAADWPPQRAAYLQLSDSYVEEAGKAERAGMLVAHLPSHHLAMMTMPDEVGDALQVLLEKLNFNG